MKASVLIGIIQRLEAMMNSGNESEVRRFEIEGVEKCQVTYLKDKDEFELKESDTGVTYQFDDVDLVAVEIFDLLG